MPEPVPAMPETTPATASSSTGPPVQEDASPTPSIVEASQPETTAGADAGSASADPELEELEEPEVELPGASDPASFANFMMSIASNAASSLGMMEHPVTHKREVDLELGKHWIDVLGMLDEKTRGNLLPQEQQILEGLLADLRMQFVSLSNATPKARSFTSQDITGG
jgi:hypothetical protein